MKEFPKWRVMIAFLTLIVLGCILRLFVIGEPVAGEQVVCIFSLS